MAELILEIGTEEIPARMLRKAERDLKTALEAVLSGADLSFSPLEAYGAPRQLTVFAREVATMQADRVETVTGPPVRIAYDEDGKPTRALEGFLKKNPGLSLESLTRVAQKKGEVVAGEVKIEGRATRDILAEAIPTILGKLHFPKTMRWGHCPTRFVRPVRNLLALLDREVIPFSFAGVETTDQSFGHRVFGTSPFAVTGIDQYLEEKKRQGILVRHQDRRASIVAQLEKRIAETGGSLVPDEDLLDEITDLVELPHVVLGTFPADFLDIPREVLIVSLRDHQKSFCVQDEQGKLKPYFLSIASIEADTEGLVEKGNEWVLNARLWDARFFWESDRKKHFEDLRQKLHNMVFQTKLGSFFEKTERMRTVAAHMADALGLSKRDKGALDEATRHAKSDLVSELVFEFAELQGITGGLLMRDKGTSEAIAKAVYDHYLPESMDGDIPETVLGALVSIADKLDTLVGCFSVGLIPTGTKDPYALRRATQGIVRLMIEKELPLSLRALLERAAETYRTVVDTPDDLLDQLEAFFAARVRYYLERQGFAHDLIEAVMARDTDRIDQTQKRAEAVARQQRAESFRALALNHKRMGNIIADEADALGDFEEHLLEEQAEHDLWNAYQRIREDVHAAVDARDYNAAMDKMASLAEPVETYFGSDGVFVNADDQKIRLNRKSMIDRIRELLGLVADISRLE